MEAAEELVRNPTKRSVLFLFFTGEETGLTGSRYFVEHCPVPLEQIKPFINVDEVGGKKDDNKMEIITGSRSEIPHSFEKTMLAAGKILDKAKLKIDKKKPKPYQLDYVDEYSFLKKGIPIIFIGTSPNYGDHTPGDDVEKIDFEHLHEVTRYIHALVLELGNQ
jgi:Zn-dependent M28 family amino/carboxypeptidase